MFKLVYEIFARKPFCFHTALKMYSIAHLPRCRLTVLHINSLFGLAPSMALGLRPAEQPKSVPTD